MWSYFYLLLALIVQCCSADIELEQNAFKIFRQNQKESQKNHVKLRFKTIHSTGLLMFAQGANKKDFLSIELFRGKIRIAGNYGQGMKNSLRPIDGIFEMYLGKDLADNEWHSVEFIRNIREHILYIDRGTVNEKHNFLKSPPTYTELSVSMVSFGGYFTFFASELDFTKSLARKGLKACFSVATFSQTWPQDPSKEIDFLTDSSRGNAMDRFVHFGEILGNCQAPTPEYEPSFFPSSAVHISLLETYSLERLKISIMFRTVISDQTLANYTSIRTGQRIQFRIDRSGRISLSIDIDNNIHIIETSKENYHDGEWHHSYFEINNELQDGRYLAKFSTDGKTRLSTLSSSFLFNGNVHIGFGYTGCLNDVRINDQPIHQVETNEANKFFTIYDIGVVHNACSLKDYCNPNPCKNGGKCNQTEDNIVCNCRDTLYEGSTCHRARFNYTCAGVRKSGERRSDVYYIDFDGMGPMEPVKALCDLGRTVETTTTQINNTKYLDVDVTSSSGINTMVVSYAADIVQMRELIMNSAFCEQYIKFTCKGAPLFRSPEGPPATSWMGGDDILHYYWGGAHNNRGYCACGIDQSCRNNEKYCNCDDLEAYQDVWDEGNFTIKEHLPVRSVKFEEVLKSGTLQAILRVGHLRCSGFGSRINSATFRKIWSFLAVDHADQPFDKIDAGGISFDFKTSVAYNYMVMLHAHGPFSGNYVKVVIISTTLIRVHFNVGFGDLKQDVDITGTGRTINDNDWHEFHLMFNIKELNVTLDGIEMIQGLPLREDPFQFSVDGKPVYIGGTFHDKHGFVGCIRSLYINGRIHNIREIAEGMADFGVYPGCGSACMLIPHACNFGNCIDYYDSFKCNCTVSPNDGKYCENESHPKKFSAGQYVTYDLQEADLTEPVAELLVVFGFKTSEENVALAQINGEDERHFSLSLANGYITLLYNTKVKEKRRSGLVQDTETNMMQITKRKLNNNQHNVVQLRVSTEEIILTVVNYDLSLGANFTERFIDPNNLNKGVKTDVFGKITRVTVGTIFDENELIDLKGATLPTSFIGCMSGAKIVYSPRATRELKYRNSIEIDIFELIERDTKSTNPSGQLPSTSGRCGPEFPAPGALPSVGPPIQFNTKSPGLEISIGVTEINAANQAVLMVVIIILVTVLLGFLYFIYRKVNVNRMDYNKEKKRMKNLTNPNIEFQRLHEGEPLKPLTEFSPDKQSTSRWNEPSDDEHGVFL